MARWMKPTEELPCCEVGDRVLVIMRETERGKWVRRLVILEAKEEGWESPDPTYVGYSPEDGQLWAMEKDVVQVAAVACGD